MSTKATVTVEAHWGTLVALRRQSLNLSQRQLADLAATTPQTIWKVERGTIAARDDLKLRIARALGTSVSALFPYADEVGT